MALFFYFYRTVVNANEIGNLVWGFVLQYHGSFINPNWIAEMGSRGRMDEKWEQKAISIGKKYALLPKYNTQNFEKSVNDYRITTTFW